MASYFKETRNLKAVLDDSFMQIQVCSIWK